MIEADGFITCHPAPVNDLPGLHEARGIIADTPHHSDTTIARACEAVMSLSDDAGERAKARGLLAVVQGERRSA